MATPAPQLSAQHKALYQSTVQTAASGGAELMGKLVGAARTALQAREAASRDMRERDALAESAKQLRSWESALCKRYPVALLEAFNNPEAPKSASSRAVADLHFDQLELMDEVDVLTSVALARIQQVAMLAAEASLADLNTLICSTLGLGSVQPERNPLRPEVYVRALKNVVEQTKVPAAVQLDWLTAMSVTLGQELRTLYVNLSSNLRREGVVGASYAVLQTPNAVGIGRGVAQANSDAAADKTVPVSAGPRGSNAGSGSAPSRSNNSVHVRGKDDALLTLDTLRRLLSGELEPGSAAGRVQSFAEQFARDFESGPAPAEATQSDFDATVPAALEALTEMKQVDRVVQSLQQRRAATPATSVGAEDVSVDAVRLSLRRNAKGIAQALSLEVVSLMVDNMVRDPRLLEPVQKIIQNLEPALLRLALVDPRFFTDKQHAARLLLQEITHRSLAYSSVDAPGFDGYVRQVELAVAPLFSMVIDSVEPFAKVLQQLNATWAEREKQKEQEREHAVMALQNAEQRNLLAEKIAREIDAHPDAASVPDVVIDFLCGPWAQVVAQARIAGGSGSSAADKFQALISAMLWSAHPDLARKNVAKLTKLMPMLLATLRDGLETIRYPATKTSVFLESLMGVHQLAFRRANQAINVAAQAAALPEATESAPSTSGRARWVEDGNPWVAPEEAEASNFIDISDDVTVAPALPTAAGAVDAAPATPASSAAVAVATEVPLHELPLGSWVELMVNDQWTRTQLTWASPHGTLFLFTSVFGTTQSMTRRSRDKLVEAGKLRVVSGQPVVEGALDAVAQIAMRNSVDTGS